MPGNTIGTVRTGIKQTIPQNQPANAAATGSHGAAVNGTVGALNGIKNGQMPKPIQQRMSPATEAIRQLIARVRLDEKTPSNPAAFAVSCVNLPPQTGPAVSVIQTQDNAIDCLLKASNMRALGPLGFINAADSRYVGGALDERVDFKYETLLLEETACTLLRGSKASLDAAAASYPLGQKEQKQHQLYSKGLTFRHSADVRSALSNAPGSGRARIDAQRAVLLNAAFGPPGANDPRVDMISIAGLDRRGMPSLDAQSMYDGMLRQFSHALVTAKQQGVKTLILTFPGSGEFSKAARGGEPDGQYLDLLSCAAADAVNFFGSGLNIVVPTHGRSVDMRFSQYRSASMSGLMPAGLNDRLGLQSLPTALGPQPMRQQSNATVGNVPAFAPSAPLEEGEMGSQKYLVEPDNLAAGDSAVTNVLKHLIGDGRGLTLRRVQGITPPTAGSQKYWFINRDRTACRALVSVEISQGKREVYEVGYDRDKHPDLLREAGKARPK